MKIGDKVIWDGGDLATIGNLSEGTVKGLKSDTVTVVTDSEGEVTTLYKAFVWPATVRGELEALIATRAGLKKAFDDSMKQVYQLLGRLVRKGEL